MIVPKDIEKQFDLNLNEKLRYYWHCSYEYYPLIKPSLGILVLTNQRLIFFMKKGITETYYERCISLELEKLKKLEIKHIVATDRIRITYKGDKQLHQFRNFWGGEDLNKVLNLIEEEVKNAKKYSLPKWFKKLHTEIRKDLEETHKCLMHDLNVPAIVMACRCFETASIIRLKKEGKDIRKKERENRKARYHLLDYANMLHGCGAISDRTKERVGYLNDLRRASAHSKTGDTLVSDALIAWEILLKALEEMLVSS